MHEKMGKLVDSKGDQHDFCHHIGEIQNDHLDAIFLSADSSYTDVQANC